MCGGTSGAEFVHEKAHARPGRADHFRIVKRLIFQTLPDLSSVSILLAMLFSLLTARVRAEPQLVAHREKGRAGL
jgi:hypothetical protein